MIEKELSTTLSDFIEVVKLAGHYISDDELIIEYLHAPHTPKALPKNKMAMYGFSHQNKWLKIGIAGPKSNARFHSQHYNPKSARSTLAASIIKDRQSYNNTLPDDDLIGAWIKKEVSRVNIYIDSHHPRELLALLEAFFHLKFQPIYER